MQPDYCETNSGYLAAGVVIHMDDSENSVQVRQTGNKKMLRYVVADMDDLETTRRCV
jgi:hypothetical protein